MEKDIIFQYTFKFKDRPPKVFKIKLDGTTLNLVNENFESQPDWTRLKNFKCPHCPLSENDYEFCPLAVSLADVIDSFSNMSSYEQIELVINTEEREFRKETSLQDGVRSMLGIKMATCGCPVMGKFKPMARFHLPFANLEETQYRYFSMYMLAQYFIAKREGKADWEMHEFRNILEDVRVLNLNVSRKVAQIEAKDTTINSVVILNNFADYVSFNLDEQSLNEVEVLFNDYFGY